MTDENGAVSLAAISVIGGRREQQDCVGWSLQPEGGLFAVCDGMGGHAGGQKASSTAIDRLLAAYEHAPAVTDPAGFLQRTAAAIDREIHAMKDPVGAPLGAGEGFASHDETSCMPSGRGGAAHRQALPGNAYDPSPL